MCIRDSGNGGVITPTVTIQPVNPGPDAVNQTVSTTPDTPVVIDPLANDIDLDGDVLTVTEINGVALTPGVSQTIAVPNGTVTVAANGTITVTPDTGFAVTSMCRIQSKIRTAPAIRLCIPLKCQTLRQRW